MIKVVKSLFQNTNFADVVRGIATSLETGVNKGHPIETKQASHAARTMSDSRVESKDGQVSYSWNLEGDLPSFRRALG